MQVVWQLLLVLGVLALVLGLPKLAPGALQRLYHHSAPALLSKVHPDGVCALTCGRMLASSHQHYQG